MFRKLHILSIFCFFLFSISTKAQQKIDSFLQLEGEDRYYELNTLYANNYLQNKKLITQLNNIVEKKGTESDKLIKYFWLKKRPILDSILYTLKGVEIFEEMAKKAEELQNYCLAAGYYISIGVIYNELKMYNKSFENQLYTLDALEKDPKGKYFQQSLGLHIIANKYYEFKDYTKAAYLSKIASTLSSKYRPNVFWFEKVNTNLVGMSYLKNAQYDSALIWLQKTKQLAVTEKDSTWIGITTGNIGTLYYLQNNCKVAIQNYLQAIPLCKKGNAWDNVASFSNNLADCYLIEGNYSEIPFLIAQSASANAKDVKNNSYLANQVKLYTIAETYYRKKGNNELTLQYADSLKKYQSLYNNAFDISKKIKDEGEFAYRSKELQNKLLLNETKLQKQALIFVCLAVILIAFFVIFYIKRINLRKKLAEKNKEILEHQLLASKKEILDFTHFIVEKNKLIEEYAQEVEALKNQNQFVKAEQLGALHQLRNRTILTNDDWLRFKVLFEKLYPDFFSYFKTNYPDLTQAEIRFLAFTKLDISPKEMSSLLGVGDEAIRTLRYRLKKKLNLTDSKEIEQIVLSI